MVREGVTVHFFQHWRILPFVPSQAILMKRLIFPICMSKQERDVPFMGQSGRAWWVVFKSWGVKPMAMQGLKNKATFSSTPWHNWKGWKFIKTPWIEWFYVGLPNFWFWILKNFRLFDGVQFLPNLKTSTGLTSMLCWADHFTNPCAQNDLRIRGEKKHQSCDAHFTHVLPHCQ